MNRPPKASDISDARALAIIDEIETGAASAVWAEEPRSPNGILQRTPREFHCGEGRYRVRGGSYDGYTVVVFIDAGDFDYIDRILDPTGAQIWGFMEGSARHRDEDPEHEHRWPDDYRGCWGGGVDRCRVLWGLD